jgi:hypothetical protein
MNDTRGAPEALHTTPEETGKPQEPIECQHMTLERHPFREEYRCKECGAAVAENDEPEVA